ncbi:RlmE family RNA methyltransferase [Candidatus Peregrinibacteria bacterium]|nr:RlmE family RNA methyltransferase [Candidatus Peregrinibacteria bacterium]
MSKVYQPHDRFFKKAKEQGYRARSAFKLQAIQARFHLIRPGDKVLDLGAAPGSFLQLIGKLVGLKGMAIGIDLKPIKDLKKPNVKTMVGDILDDNIYHQLGIGRFDVITSDLAPSTSGIKSLDAGRSFQLNEQVLKVAERYLKPGGHVVMKAFPGAEHDTLLKKAKGLFKTIKVFKPEAVRRSSREVYLVGLHLKS